MCELCDMRIEQAEKQKRVSRVVEKMELAASKFMDAAQDKDSSRATAAREEYSALLEAYWDLAWDMVRLNDKLLDATLGRRE